jgi:ribosomal protein S18 acetylase RimI-like enzyme
MHKTISTSIDVAIKHDQKYGLFQVLHTDGTRIAELSYDIKCRKGRKSADRILQLKWISTEENYRKQGHANQLLLALAKFAESQKIATMTLSAANTAFWKHYGLIKKGLQHDVPISCLRRHEKRQ